MAETLQDFLISVKYGIDAPSQERFFDALKRVATSVAGIAGQLVGLSVAVLKMGESMSDTASKLYWMSQRTGESIGNIEAMKFALEGVGVAGEEAVAALNQMSSWSHRMGPAGANYLRSLGITATETGAQVQQLAERLSRLRPNSAEYAIEMARLQQFGFSETLMLRMGSKEYREGVEDKKNIARLVWGNPKDQEEYGKMGDKVVTQFSRMYAIFDDLRKRFGLGLFRVLLKELERLNDIFLKMLPQMKAFSDQMLAFVPALMHYLEAAVIGFGNLLQIGATLIRTFHQLPDVLKEAVAAFILLPKALDLLKSPLFWMLAGLTALLLLMDDYQHWQDDEKAGRKGKDRTSYYRWDETDGFLKGIENNKTLKWLLELNTEMDDWFAKITGVHGVFIAIEAILGGAVFRYAIPALLKIAGSAILTSAAGGAAAEGAAVAGGAAVGGIATGIVLPAVAVAIATAIGTSLAGILDEKIQGWLKMMGWERKMPQGAPVQGPWWLPGSGAGGGGQAPLPDWLQWLKDFSLKTFYAPKPGEGAGPRVGKQSMNARGGTQIASAGDDWAAYIQQGMDDAHKDDTQLYDMLKANLEAAVQKLGDIFDTLFALALKSGADVRGIGGSGAAGGGGDGNMDVPDLAGMTEDERNKLALIRQYESGGRNVMNAVGVRLGVDPRQARGSTAQGYYQMLNSNWAKIAPLYNITAPNAMAATDAEQTQVALHLLRHGGIGNWTNWNPALRDAVARGEHGRGGVPQPGVTSRPNLGHLPLGGEGGGGHGGRGWRGGGDTNIHNNTQIAVTAPNPASAAHQVADVQSRVHEQHIRYAKGALLA